MAIPAGTHRVRWTYTAPGITAGALAALLGLLGLGALAWLGRPTRTVAVLDYPCAARTARSAAVAA